VKEAAYRVYITCLIEGKSPTQNTDKKLKDWKPCWTVQGTPFQMTVGPGYISGITDQLLGDLERNIDAEIERYSSGPSSRYYSSECLVEMRDGYEKAHRYAGEKLREIQKTYGDPCTTKEAMDQLEIVSKQLKDYCDKWDKLLIELKKAEHLFIAV
jgi:hypothetical protein